MIRLGAAIVVVLCLVLIAMPGQIRIGSAFAVTDGSLLVTARHVVAGCADIRIAEMGRASVLMADAAADIAILKPARPFETALAFRGERQVTPGEEIVVIGYPLREARGSRPTVTTGTIAAVAATDNDHTPVQTAAPLQVGSSGGPVLDRAGNVVGMVVARLDPAGVTPIIADIPQNLFVAIKSSTIASVLQRYSPEHEAAALGPKPSIEDLAAAALPAVSEVRCALFGLRLGQLWRSALSR